jgi:hypothetical protein
MSSSHAAWHSMTFPVPKVSRDFNNLSFGDMRRMPSDVQAKRSVVNACNLRPRSDRRRRRSDHCRPGNGPWVRHCHLETTSHIQSINSIISNNHGLPGCPSPDFGQPEPLDSVRWMKMQPRSIHPVLQKLLWPINRLPWPKKDYRIL